MNVDEFRESHGSEVVCMDLNLNDKNRNESVQQLFQGEINVQKKIRGKKMSEGKVRNGSEFWWGHSPMAACTTTASESGELWL